MWRGAKRAYTEGKLLPSRTAANVYSYFTSFPKVSTGENRTDLCGFLKAAGPSTVNGLRCLLPQITECCNEQAPGFGPGDSLRRMLVKKHGCCYAIPSDNEEARARFHTPCRAVTPSTPSARGLGVRVPPIGRRPWRKNRNRMRYWLFQARRHTRFVTWQLGRRRVETTGIAHASWLEVDDGMEATHHLPSSRRFTEASMVSERLAMRTQQWASTGAATRAADERRA